MPKLSDVPLGPSRAQGTGRQPDGELYPDSDASSRPARPSISRPGSTANFAEFREAIGEVQNGGSGWRVAMDEFLRRARMRPAINYLAASLKISKVSVDKPH